MNERQNKLATRRDSCHFLAQTIDYKSQLFTKRLRLSFVYLMLLSFLASNNDNLFINLG